MPSPVLFRWTRDPWGRPADLGPPLHSKASLLGEPKPLLDAWGRPISGADDPSVTPPAHGITWAGELLAYRMLWDDYVMGTARAALAGVASYRALVAGTAISDPTLVPAAAAHPDPQAFTELANALEGGAETLTNDWNQYANKADWEIMTFAGDYLLGYQRVVKQVGTLYQPSLRSQFPQMKLPAPPGLDPQAAVIGRLQGMNIVASGTLELLGIGTSGALEMLGKVTEKGGQVLGHAADKVITLMDVLPWAIGGVGLLALLAIMVAGTKYGSESIGHVARAARVVPDPARGAEDPDALIIVPSEPVVTLEDA